MAPARLHACQGLDELYLTCGGGYGLLIGSLLRNRCYCFSE